MPNLSAVLYGPSDLRLEDADIPEPRDNEVLIATKCVGVCGSDIHVWKEFGFADQMLSNPVVLGHECSGIVAKVGSLVNGLKEGDRVAVEPGVPCKECRVCRLGRYNLCDRVNNPIHGCFAQYFTHPADFCFKLPPTVTFEEGALVEPLSVAIHACNRAELSPGQTILICGSGTIGLMCLLVAKAIGMAQVCITDISGERLALAKMLGADQTVLIKPGQSVPETLHFIKQYEAEPDVSFECSGARSSTEIALKATKSGGSVILVGFGANEMKLPLLSATVREVDIKGSFSYAHCFPAAIAMLQKGLNVKPLITHRFELPKTVEAFETVLNPTKSVLKVIVNCDL